MGDFIFEILAAVAIGIAGTLFARQLAMYQEWQKSDSLLLRSIAFLLGAGGFLLVAFIVIWFLILPGN